MAMSLSCTALKILLRSRRTSSSQRRQSTRSQASPSKAGNTGRGSSGPFTEVSNLSFSSGICFRFASKAHLPTSASFRTRAPARYPASYAKTIREEFPILRPLTSCCLSAAGIRFLGTLSCQGIQPPLTVGLPHRLRIPAPEMRTHSRVSTFRTRETQTGPGALCTPGTAVLTGHAPSAAAACRLSTAGPCHPGDTTQPGV